MLQALCHPKFILDPGLFFFRALCLLPGLMLAVDGQAQNMTPIAVTGFNRDVVIENTASGPPYFAAALEFNPGENTAFYQSGLPGTSFGLPLSGTFTSAIGDGTVFQFQPYTGDNALVLSSETGLSSGTLSLVTPATYSRIAVIANSGNGGGTPNLTLNFADGSSVTTNYNAQDWFFNPGFALQGVDRINLSSGFTQGGPNDPRFYQTSVDVAGLVGPGNNKPLTSLTFDAAFSARSTGIYAVSGLAQAAIQLPAVSNFPVSNLLASTATFSGQVTSTGGEAPTVTIFYGPTDGGTSAAAWASSVSQGVQTGVFGASVGGLTPNRTYYYTASAVNSRGTAWATPSQNLHTPVLAVATVINLPATNIQGTLATLNGALLSTGGDLPALTLYYGPADGRTNSANWAHNVALGTQNGVFAQTVTGLTPSTTYFFSVKAVNSAGVSWAAPSGTFQTSGSDTPSSFFAVLTHHNDLARTGANLKETSLNTANVSSNRFGLVFSRPVDDQMYAQPLVVTDVNVLGRGTHNLVILATVNDSLYAFDADDPAAVAPYWQVSLLGPNEVAPQNSDMTFACGGNYRDFSGRLGIVGTPVVDITSGTLYVVARTKESDGSFVQRLHALDVASGAERSNSPATITATHPGNGPDSIGGIVTFDPQKQNQRPGLALVNGVVYIGWSSHCDWGPYHGWLIGYDAATLAQTVVYNATPNGSQAGIWMSGQAPSADAGGNLYLSTGNGTVGDGGDPLNTTNRGESFLKLTRSGSTLSVASWFTPYNWQTLENGDIDLGSAGLLLIPGTHLALSGGKQGVLYLVDRDNMGGLSSSPGSDANVVQSFQVTFDQIHGGPVWWDGPGGSYAYVWPSSVNLQQYKFDGGSGTFLLPAFAQSPTSAPFGQPGGILAVSANGTNAGSGILWAAHQLVGDANQSVQPGILHAFDAQNVGTELWNSEQVRARDSVGNFAKFVPPTVANGKVYLATFSNRLNVYGLLPRPSLSIMSAGTSLVLSWPISSASGYTLQSTGNVGGNNWSSVSNTPIQTNGYYQVTLPVSTGATFYRLKQ